MRQFIPVAKARGLLAEKGKAKIRQFPRPLTIIGKKEIEPFLKYAKKTYGDDFTKIYSKRGFKKRAG